MYELCELYVGTVCTLCYGLLCLHVCMYVMLRTHAMLWMYDVYVMYVWDACMFCMCATNV